MQKRHCTIVFMVGLVSCALTQAGYAAIIAQDNFDSYSLGSIAGLGTIGDGWLNTWGGYAGTNPTSVRDVVADEFAPGGNQSLALGYSGTINSTIRANALTRQFTEQTDTFYVGFRLKTIGMSDANDIFQLYFNNNNSTSSTGTNGTSLSFMISGGNRSIREGGEDESVFAANVDDVVERIVLRFSKSTPGGNYDQFAVFVNQADDSTPTLSIVAADPYSGPGDIISALHVRMRYTAASDRVHLDDLMIGTTYAEAPEPASLSLLVLAAAASLRVSPLRPAGCSTAPGRTVLGLGGAVRPDPWRGGRKCRGRMGRGGVCPARTSYRVVQRSVSCLVVVLGCRAATSSGRPRWQLRRWVRFRISPPRGARLSRSKWA
jgi:hypothetical protein